MQRRSTSHSSKPEVISNTESCSQGQLWHATMIRILTSGHAKTQRVLAHPHPASRRGDAQGHASAGHTRTSRLSCRLSVCALGERSLTMKGRKERHRPSITFGLDVAAAAPGLTWNAMASATTLPTSMYIPNMSSLRDV